MNCSQKRGLTREESRVNQWWIECVKGELVVIRRSVNRHMCSGLCRDHIHINSTYVHPLLRQSIDSCHILCQPEVQVILFIRSWPVLLLCFRHKTAECSQQVRLVAMFLAQIVHSRWPTDNGARACVEIKSMSIPFVCIPSHNKAQIAVTSFASPRYS